MSARLPHPCLLIGLLLTGGACSDPVTSDAGPADQGLAISEGGLALCPGPGQICRPADPCGLNPRCGADHLCRSLGRRRCDDGISCTEDRCVPGGCEHRVTSGSCLIEGVCYPAGASPRPCGRCQPELNALAWTPVSGQPCDDQNLCTHGDACRQGVCAGQFYSCNDGLSCTDDACDGKAGCHHYLRSGSCLIDKVCYREGQTSKDGCLVCVPSSASQSWTLRKNVCSIAGKCHGAGEQDTSGCSFCDPVQAPQAWTPLPDLCSIGGSCLAPGSLHPSGCAYCAPTLSSQYWSPLPGAQLSWFPFSSGLADFDVSNSTSGVGWQISQNRHQSAPASLYYGTATQTYDSKGSSNQGTITSPVFSLPPGQRAYLAFSVYLDVDPAEGVDLLRVKAEGTTLWLKSAKTMAPGDYKRWKPVLVELTALAGKSIALQLEFDTVDSMNNSSEGVYVDDLTILSGCGGP